jgi:hypothetical protein
MDDLPPDLARLGRDLTVAINRSLRWQQWRRRLVKRAATVATSGAMIFLAMTPAVLQPASVALDAWGMLPWTDDTQTVALQCDSPPRQPAPACDDLAPGAATGPAAAVHEWTRPGRSASGQGRRAAYDKAVTVRDELPG